MNKETKRKYIVMLIIMPLILKLILAFIMPGHIGLDESGNLAGDTQAYKRVTETMLSGQNPYSVKELDPYWLGYGSMFFVLFYINGLITQITGLPFHFVMKIFPLIAETLISVILFLMLKKRYSMKKSFYWSLIFALNPASLAVTSIHGQFDAIPILSTFLAYYFFTSGKGKVRNVLPAICLGIGSSVKYFPLLLLPIFFFKYEKIKEKMVFIITAIVSIFITYIPFIISGDLLANITNTFGYSPQFRWGIAKFFLLLNRFNISSLFIVSIENFLKNYSMFILAAALIITILIYSKVKSLGRSCKAIFFCLYTFSFFIHPHYLTWIIPFLFLEINFKEILYIIPLTGHMYFLYIIGLIGIGIGIEIDGGTLFQSLSFIFGVLTWIFCIWMYFSYLKKDIKNIQLRKIFSIRYWLYE